MDINLANVCESGADTHVPVRRQGSPLPNCGEQRVLIDGVSMQLGGLAALWEGEGTPAFEKLHPQGRWSQKGPQNHELSTPLLVDNFHLWVVASC